MNYSPVAENGLGDVSHRVGVRVPVGRLNIRLDHPLRSLLDLLLRVTLDHGVNL